MTYPLKNGQGPYDGLGGRKGRDPVDRGGREGRDGQRGLGGQPRTGPPTSGGTRRRIDPEGRYTQPFGPLEKSQVDLLSFYNSITTDDEFREVFGVFDPADIETLRRNPNLLAAASPYWWDRLQVFHNDVESGKRTLDIQRRMRRYEQAEADGRLITPRAKPVDIPDVQANFAGATPAIPADTRQTMMEDLTDASQEGADYIPGNYSPRADRFKAKGGLSSALNILEPAKPVAESIARFAGWGPETEKGDIEAFKTIGRGLEQGELPLSLPTRPADQAPGEIAPWVKDIPVVGKGVSWLEEQSKVLPNPRKWLQEHAPLLVDTADNPNNIYSIPIMEELFKSSERSKPEGLSQVQRELYELSAAHDERPFIQQLGSDPLNIAGPISAGAFALKGLGKGLFLASRKIPFSQLGRIELGRLPATFDTLASHTSRGVGRIGGLPGIRLLTRPLAGKSVEFNQHVEGSVEEALARSPTLWHSMLEMGQRYSAVILSKARAQGDWGKTFGLVKKNGLPTNRMTKVHGSPFVGDVMELADLDMADEILEFGARYTEDVTETIGKTAEDIVDETWAWRYRHANQAITFAQEEAMELGDDIAPELLKKLDDAVEVLRVEGQKLGFDDEYIYSVSRDSFGYTEADIARGLSSARLGAEGVKVTRQVDKVRRIMPVDKTGAHPEWAEVDRLSREQIDMIRFIRIAYYDALKMMRDEGVNVKELGEFMDGFHYVARKVGREWKMVPARSGGPGLVKGRTIDPATGFVKTMGQQIAAGNRYLDPLETLSLYLDETYRLVAKKRLTEYLRPFSREQEVEKIVKTRASVGKKHYRRVKQSIGVVRRVLIHGGGTASMTRAMMRRTFPSLANDIDAALSFKGLNSETAVKAVTDAMLDKDMATWPLFRKELKSLIGRTPRMIERNDVKAVVETLSKDVEAKIRLTNDVYQAVFKGIKAHKETQLKQLLDRMESLAPMSEKAAATARAELRRRTKQLGKPIPGAGEAETSRLPGLIFGESEELGRIRGVKNPQEFANRLEGMLDDMGLKQFGVMEKLVKFNDAVRWMKTTWDFGHVMIQGLPLLARDPEAWGKSVGLSMRAFVDDGVRASYVAKNHERITRMIQYGGHIGSTEFTDTMASGGWFAMFPHVMQSMPGPAIAGNVTAGGARMITRLAGRFQESFEVFLDVGRIETWSALEGVAMRSSNPEKALHELGSFVNKLTGTSSSAAIGIGATQRQIESTFFMFSPRYTRATLALISDMVRGGLRGNEARIAVGRLMAGQVMFHNAGAMALGQEPNLIPGQGDFLKWEIEGQYVGFGGKFNALMNLSMDLFEQLRDNPGGLITKDIFSSESYDTSDLLRRLRYQTSVLTGTFMDFMTETSPIGKRFRDPDDERDLGYWARNIPMALVERYGPFYIDAVNEALGGFVSPGPKAAGVAGGAEFIGLSSFPIQAREMRDRKRDELAKEFYGMSVDKVREDINYGEMLAKIDTQPEMVKLMEAADEEAREFSRNDERFEIQDRRTEIDDEFVRALERVSEDFAAGRFGNSSGEVIREVWKSAIRTRRERLDEVRIAHSEYFEGVSDYYREMADRNPTMAATAEFMDRAFIEENFDSQGRPNYAQFDAIKADLVDKYGAEAVEASELNARLRLKQLGLPEPIQDLMKAWETLRPYWDTYKDVLPEEHWEMWRMYDSATDTEKTAMETSAKFDFQRWAAEIELERKYKQRDNYDMDEALMVFYDRRPMDRDLLYRYMRRGQR